MNDRIHHQVVMIGASAVTLLLTLADRRLRTPARAAPRPEEPSALPPPEESSALLPEEPSAPLPEEPSAPSPEESDTQ